MKIAHGVNVCKSVCKLIHFWDALGYHPGHSIYAKYTYYKYILYLSVYTTLTFEQHSKFTPSLLVRDRRKISEHSDFS